MELVDLEFKLDVPFIPLRRGARDDMTDHDQNNGEARNPVDFDESALSAALLPFGRCLHFSFSAHLVRPFRISGMCRNRPLGESA